jgi:hypothetical protein
MERNFWTSSWMWVTKSAMQIREEDGKI